MMDRAEADLRRVISVDEKSSQPDGRAETQRIELTVPGRPEYVVVVRLAAAAVAGRMPFSFDDIEDLKVAVGEVCTAAILAGTPELQVWFDVAADRLEIRVTHRPTRTGRPPQEQELDKLLVQVLMDEVRTSTVGADHVTHMVKRVAG